MSILSAIAAILMIVALLLRLKRELMMLQQNSYRNERYKHWLSESKDSTTPFHLLGWLVFFFDCLSQVPLVLRLTLAAIYGAWTITRLYFVKYKKPLVFTARAKRIYSVSIALCVLPCIAFMAMASHSDFNYLMIIIVQTMLLAQCMSSAILICANWLLKPIEKKINQGYYDDAATILASMPDLKVIGITGSYGKTSTKHYLYRILSEQYDVLMTPGNFNTTLGVIRTIREQMKPYNQIFIAEMGAKQPHDIKEICDLVRPQYGIITAVGPQHLESFGTIENVQATKFELADALPSDGLIIVNDDFEYIANRKVENVECVRYTVDDNHSADYRATNIRYTPQGTYFTIKQGNEYQLDLHTKLVGSCNVSNLIAAVIMAKRLGLSDEKIRYAVEKIEQVEHRLNMKHTVGGITIIDDAYNSNPVGSAMALDVLSSMNQGQRIVITPGMIELGKDQYELNRQFGEKIATSADIALIVGEYNRKAITEGIDSNPSCQAKVMLAATFAEAQQMMLGIAKAGDTVLYENDLPDTFK